MLTAMQCRYQMYDNDGGSEWKTGIALLSSPDDDSVILIVPHNATNRDDVPITVWDYKLLRDAGMLTLD